MSDVKRQLTFGSLFAGIGGFDLGLGRAGMKCHWQVENDKRKIKVLEQHYPSTRRSIDVRCCHVTPVDLVCGGDPCPSRSRARGNRPSKHPDMSGYFLAVVARLRPLWVVRENVPAPDAFYFAAALEAIGYRVVALAFDSRDFTGQSRRRDYLCACTDHGAAGTFQQIVSDASESRRFSPSRSEEETPIAACLTAHGNRMAAEDNFCFEPERGLRILSAEEAEALQGFPPILQWRTGRMSRDEFAVALLASGHVRVDAATGKVYCLRGPGGIALAQPVEVGNNGNKGYLVANFRLAGERKQLRLNRLVWIAEYGIPPDGMAVCHKNNIKTDNRIENLKLGTSLENIQDATDDGLMKSGEENPAAKITEAVARQICDDYQHGRGTLRALAERYGLSKSRIHQIVNLEGWTSGFPEQRRRAMVGEAVTVPVVEWIGRRIIEAASA